jgi:hypothetical protein
VHRGVVETFSATLLVGGGGNQLIYESCSHLLKTSMRRRKEVHARSPRLASPGVARVHVTCVNGLPKSGFSPCGSAIFFCSFSFLSLGLLSPKRTQLRATHDCVSRGRFPGLYKWTTGHAKTYLIKNYSFASAYCCAVVAKTPA